MNKHNALSLAVAGTLAFAVSNSAVAQVRDLKTRTPTITFLQPLKLDLVLRAGDPRLPQFCANSGMRCPPIVANGRIPGGLGDPDDFVGTGNQNVRVTLHVQEITNTPVANGGANVDQTLFLHWFTSSAAADVESGGPYMWPVPSPGESSSGFSEFSSASGMVIYEGLKFNACGALGEFPIDHTAAIIDTTEEYGAFVGGDSTIDATGYYNLSYTVRAEDADGGVSDFRVEGIAVALCSGLNSL